MMMKKYKFGVIGAGMIAQEHLKNIYAFPEASVKGISALESDRETLEMLAKKYNIALVTCNYKEILDDKEIDAVIIGTPPFTHKEIFTACIEAGKHVLIEKPLTITPGELDEMTILANQHPELKVCDASCRHSRLQPKFNYIKDLIESGRLGDIYYIHHNALYRQSRPGIEYHPPAKWFLDKDKSGGGLVIDWGVYDFSFHLGVLGDKPEFVSLINFLKNGLDKVDHGAPVFNVEEHFASMMEFDNGLKYYWERSGHCNVETPDETRIYGTKGGLKFSYLSWESPEIMIYELDNKNKAISTKVEVSMDKHRDDGYELIKHFIAVLEDQEQAAMPFELAAKHLKIIFENYRERDKGLKS
jgi:predicted dehydrogenase